MRACLGTLVLIRIFTNYVGPLGFVEYEWEWINLCSKECLDGTVGKVSY